MTVQPLVVATIVADGASYRVSWFDPPFEEACARVELEPFTPTHEMTARRLVQPDGFLDTLFRGR